MAEPVVTVDGVECTVTEYDFYNIKCVTGEKELEELEEFYVGQHGVKRTWWNENGHVYFNSYQNYADTGVQSLMTTLE